MIQNLYWHRIPSETTLGALRELHLSGPVHEGPRDALRIIELQVPIAPISALQLGQ